MKKKNSFQEISDLFRDVEFNKMNSKILMAGLSAISVLSSCGDNGNGKGSEEGDKTKASKYKEFKKQHGDLHKVLQEAFKNKTYNGKTGDKALIEYINSLNPEELENLSKLSREDLETKVDSFKNGNIFDELKFKESLSKPSNKNENGKNANGNVDAVKQVNAIDPNSAENLKENEGKKKEEEEKKLLADIEKILNNLSEVNKSAKEKFIGYFKFLSEIAKQDTEKSFIESYNKSTGNTEEEKVISQLKQTLNNIFSNENTKKDLFNKLSEKVKKYVTDKLEDDVKKKVNVKATSAKKDNNIETTISYSEKANDKNVINDNKQFYVIEEVEVTNSKENKVEKIKIVVANSNEDDTLEKYEIPDLNNLVVDKKEKLKEVIKSDGEKLIKDNPIDTSEFTGLDLNDLLSKSSDFYKKLIEGKDGDDKMIIENFDKKQWIQVFNNKEDEFKKFIIKELVAIIKEYYKSLPEGIEKNELDTCSKILFGEVLNYYEDKSKGFVSIKDFYKHSDKTTLYDVSQYNGKIPMFTKSKDKDTDDIFKTYRNESKAPLYCLFNYELCKQYYDVFDRNTGIMTGGGLIFSTKGESNGMNEWDRVFTSDIFTKFRDLNDFGDPLGCPNRQYSGTSKEFREGMDEALDASFKSLQLVESKGSAKNLRTLFFQYLDQITPQQMDSITDDSFVEWMNQNNIYMSVDSMNFDCIEMFCDIFFDNFFGGKENVKAFMDAIEAETKVTGFVNTDKNKVNTAITNIQNSQKEYLDSLKNGEYTKYWYGLLTDTVLKAKS